jgi:eukaryotic-like serine/threonine-protein kinase
MRRLRRLVHEVHRRSLWQVVGIYLFGSWVGYQVILALTHGLGMPDWVPPLAFVLFLVGLPIVVATAFVNEGAPLLRQRDALRLAELETPLLRPEFAGDEESRAAGGDATSPTGADGAPPPRVRAHRLTWGRALGGGFAAFIVLGMSAGGYMGMRVAGIGPVGTLIAAGRLEANAPIVLAEFRAAGVDLLLARALTEALRVDLEQSRVVTLAQPAFVRDALRRMQLDPQASLDEATALELATREALAAVIAGDIAVAGGRWIVTARVVDPASGSALASFRETADDSTAVLAALGRVSRKLRAKIGESLRDVRASEPLAQVTTPSLEALRLYSQAMQLSLAGQEHRDRVKALLEQAIAIDTAFAMAYRKLGVEYHNDIFNPARAAEMLVKAHAHLDRLTEPERYMTLGSYHGAVTFDRAQQLAAFQTLAELYPTYPGALVNYGFALGRLRQVDRAADAYRRAVEVDSTSATAHSNLMLALTSLGRFDEARSVLDLYERRFPANVIRLHFRGILASTRGDYHALDSLGAELLQHATSPGLRMTGYTDRYIANATRGRMEAGAEFMREHRRIAEQVGGTNAMYFSELYPLSVRLIAAEEPAPLLVARVDALLAREPLERVPVLDRPYLELAYFYAHAGRTARAKELVAEYRAQVPLERQRQSSWPLAVEAMIASAEGRHADAASQFQQAYAADWCTVCYLADIAGELDRLGATDSAAVYYERFLETPDPDRRWEDALWRARALERLAQLHDAAGRDEEARRYYARFVELWEEADAPLQPRVDAARRRIAELMGGT